MQEKKDLMVGLESILCLVGNSTWDDRKIKNTETILYRDSNQSHLKTIRLIISILILITCNGMLSM